MKLTDKKELPKIKIVNEGAHGRTTRVYIDGVEQKWLTRAEIKFEVNKFNQVILTFGIAELDIETVYDPEMKDTYFTVSKDEYDMLQEYRLSKLNEELK